MSDLGRGVAWRRAGRACRVASFVLVTAVLAGCSGDGSSGQGFRSGAQESLEQMAGAVGTAGYAARLAAERDAFGTYLAVLADDARQDGESARDDALALQPPPDLAGLNGELGRVLGDAVDALHAVGDAAQAPDREDRLAAQQARLAELGRRLADLRSRLG